MKQQVVVAFMFGLGVIYIESFGGVASRAVDIQDPRLAYYGSVYCLLPMHQDFFLLQQASSVLEWSLVDMGSVVHTWWCRYVMDVAPWAHQNFPSVSLWPKWFEVFSRFLKRLIPFHISMFYVRLTSHIVPRILTLITTKV